MANKPVKKQVPSQAAEDSFKPQLQSGLIIENATQEMTTEQLLSNEGEILSSGSVSWKLSPLSRNPSLRGKQEILEKYFPRLQYRRIVCRRMLKADSHKCLNVELTVG